MKPYIFLEHTADAKFQAFGKTMHEAFSNAAIAMISIMFDINSVEKKIEKNLHIEGIDKKSLLYNWLEELLFLLDAEMFILGEIKEIKITGNRLDAVVVGDSISEKYPSHGEVKAVTYNDMEIKEEKGKCMVQVVVDL